MESQVGELVAGTASSGGGVGWRGVAAHQRLLMMLQSVKEADLAAFFIARGRQIGACFAAFCVAGAGGGQGEGQGGETGAKGHVFQKKSKNILSRKMDFEAKKIKTWHGLVICATHAGPVDL